MSCQAIDARLAFGADESIFFRGSEIDRDASGSKKRMAKIVVVEKTMDIGADDAAGITYGAVDEGSCLSLALKVGERKRSAFIERLTDVDLVAFETNRRRRIVVKKIAPQAAVNAPHGFFGAEHGAHRQKTEPGSAASHALVLDTVRIFDRKTQYLKAAADADDRDTDFSEPPKLLGTAALLDPLKIIKCLLGAGQDE